MIENIHVIVLHVLKNSLRCHLLIVRLCGRKRSDHDLQILFLDGLFAISAVHFTAILLPVVVKGIVLLDRTLVHEKDSEFMPQALIVRFSIIFELLGIF